MSLVAWAHGVAERELSVALPRRWAHVQGVARKARQLGRIAGNDAGLLEAAAILHDVGYAPRLADTGFHPLDGAQFLRTLGASTRLVDLVAHHSCAILEARLRGIEHKMTSFRDEEGPVRDALWHCDLTTTPDGERTSIGNRIAEIRHRYGPDNVVTTFITMAEPKLVAASVRTQDRMTGARVQPM